VARINLLPWREWERERKQKEFVTNLGVTLGVALVIVYLVGLYLNAAIDTQLKRNSYLEGKIVVLNERIKEIESLRETREQLLARMRVIQELQGNRPVIVRVFDEIVRTLSEGVYYTDLRKEGETISIRGNAESNNRISDLMRRIDGSEWFADPNLKGIKRNPSFGEQASSFDLTLLQVNPRQTEIDAEEG
jgi:type IV pilus assembly protein PilN